MNVVYLILLVLSAACFIATAQGRGRYDRNVSLLPLGLFFWVLVPLVQTAKGL